MREERASAICTRFVRHFDSVFHRPSAGNATQPVSAAYLRFDVGCLPLTLITLTVQNVLARGHFDGAMIDFVE
jgi:hypothetical protein